MARRRRRKGQPQVMRCDLLPSNLTASKEARVRELLRAWRKGAVLLGREQWRLFFETGRFDKNHDLDKITFASVIGAASRVQMCRWQVVGQLQGWLSNRANEFRDTVTRSSLSPDVKHMLHTVNIMGAWFSRKELRMWGTGETIPPEVRKLARTIMRHVMSRHRRPDLSHISMRLDHRAAELEKPIKARQGGKVGWWVNLSTMEKGRKIAIPLLIYKQHRLRRKRGEISNGLQVNERDGQLTFGVVTDMGEACAKSRAEYNGHGVLALDFGLSTLFATSEGDLLGRDWLKRLRAYDARITSIARHVQRSGKRPRDSRRYREAVADLRGFIRTEVGRVLNRLVAAKRPAALVLERLDFRNPNLSPRLNRLLQNCGRSAIRAKLIDLRDRFGVEAKEVNPAYTSRTCSSCGYVDKLNRPSQVLFRCLWCGHTLHADCNAARNIGQRRASPIGSVFQRKDAILEEVVRAFLKRKVRALRSGRTGATGRDADRGCSADPRLTNPYFGRMRPVTVRTSPTPPALAAA